MNSENKINRQTAAAINQIFTVLNMFDYQPGEDIRLESLLHLFEEDGASASEVDSALAYMIKNGLLEFNHSPYVLPGGHCLSGEGFTAMTQFLGTQETV